MVPYFNPYSSFSFSSSSSSSSMAKAISLGSESMFSRIEGQLRLTIFRVHFKRLRYPFSVDKPNPMDQLRFTFLEPHLREF